METHKTKEKINLYSKSPENCKKLLENMTLQSNNFQAKTEYRDQFDGTRLYNRQGPSEVYVSKRAGDESDFWSGGKYCYNNPILRNELIYLPNSRESYFKKEIPLQFKNKEHNRTVTRISEYSNAKYNGEVFINPRFLSC